MKTNILRLIAAVIVIVLAVHSIKNTFFKEEVPELTAGLFAAPGTYTASAQGYAGPVQVTAVFSENQVKSISIESEEDPQVGRIAMNEMASRIVSSQSLYVDTISGATESSRAFQDAFQVCCSEAGTDEATMENLLAGIERSKSQQEEEENTENTGEESQEETAQESTEEIEEVQQEEPEEEEEDEGEPISNIDAIIAAEHYWGHYPSERPAGYEEGYVYDTYISGYPEDDYPYYIITLIIANYEIGTQTEVARARVNIYTSEVEDY